MEASEIKSQADAAFRSSQFDTALALYTQCIESDASNAALYSNRSACFANLNKPEEALKDAESAISLKPEWGKGYFRKATALVSLDQYEPAMENVLLADKYAPSVADYASIAQQCLVKLINSRIKMGIRPNKTLIPICIYLLGVTPDHTLPDVGVLSFSVIMLQTFLANIRQEISESLEYLHVVDLNKVATVLANAVCILTPIFNSPQFDPTAPTPQAQKISEMYMNLAPTILHFLHLKQLKESIPTYEASILLLVNAVINDFRKVGGVRKSSTRFIGEKLSILLLALPLSSSSIEEGMKTYSDNATLVHALIASIMHNKENPLVVFLAMRMLADFSEICGRQIKKQMIEFDIKKLCQKMAESLEELATRPMTPVLRQEIMELPADVRQAMKWSTEEEISQFFVQFSQENARLLRNLQ